MSLFHPRKKGQPPARRGAHGAHYLDHPPPRSTTDVAPAPVPADGELDIMTTEGDLAARRRIGERLGFVPILLPFMAAKAVSKAFKKKPAEPGPLQGATMPNDGFADLDDSVWGTGNDLTGDDLGYDPDELEGDEAYGEDVFLGAVDAAMAELEGEEQACGDDVSAEAVGAGRARRRKLKHMRHMAKQRQHRAKQRGRGKRAQKLAKRVDRMDRFGKHLEARQIRREGSALAQQQAVFGLMDDGGAGGPVFGYDPSRQVIPGFATRGEINEIPFVTQEGELEYAEDTIATGTGVQTTPVVSWVTPQVTYADMRLIGVRFNLWSLSEDQGLEMRLLSLYGDGDKQAIYKTQRSQVKVYNGLGLGISDFYVRTLRDTQLILKNTTVFAQTNVRQYFDVGQDIPVRTTLTGIFETVRDPRVAASP